MNIKSKLIKLHWILASQFGIDPRVFLRSLRGLPVYLRDWARFHKDYTGPMKFMPCLHDRYEEGGTTKSEYFWQDLLVARAKRADAQKTIQNTMAGLNDNSAFDTFGRMAEKVDQLEAEASASEEIAADVSGATLDDKFKKLESSQAPTDALLALKAKMGMLPQPSAKALSVEDVAIEDIPVPDIGIKTKG